MKFDSINDASTKTFAEAGAIDASNHIAAGMPYAPVTQYRSYVEAYNKAWKAYRSQVIGDMIMSGIEYTKEMQQAEFLQPWHGRAI